MSAPNSPKTKRGANGKFLPKPLLFHLRHPNSKTNEPKFWQILSPKNSFAKTSSALFRHLPEYLEGRTPKKNVLSTFKKNFTPAKSRKQGTFFFGVAERSEAVAERYERTIQFRATTRSARAISRHQDYQQNTFELCLIHTAKIRNSNFRQKYGRREAPSVLYSPQKTLNQKGFSTLRVARRLPIQIYE
jgi:hypothetical protein